MRTLAAVVVAVSLLLVARPSTAETVDQELQRLADEGYKAYKDGRYDVAAGDFARAYAIRPVPALLYNLARAYEKQGDVKNAYEAYQKYLASDDRDVKPRRHAQEHIAALEPAYRALTAPKVEPPKVEPTKIVVTPIQQQPAGPTPEELAAARKHKRNLLVGAGAAIAVVGLAGVGAGVGLYAAAASDQTQFQGSRDFATKQSLQQDAASLGTYSTVCYVAGGALLAVGATVAILGLRAGAADERGAAASAPTTSAGPVVGPGYAGVALGGAF